MAGASVCFTMPLGEGEDSSWAGAYAAALEQHGAKPFSKGGVPREPRLLVAAKMDPPGLGLGEHVHDLRLRQKPAAREGVAICVRRAEHASARRVKRRPGAGVRLVPSCNTNNAKVRRGCE